MYTRCRYTVHPQCNTAAAGQEHKRGLIIPRFNSNAWRADVIPMSIPTWTGKP